MKGRLEMFEPRIWLCPQENAVIFGRRVDALGCDKLSLCIKNLCNAVVYIYIEFIITILVCQPWDFLT